MKRPLAVLALALLPLAGGAETLSHTWVPRTAQEADALRLGLALHSLRSSVRNGGTVRQWGENNLAALAQSGQGNWGAILQRGDGHAARLTQRGDGNAHAVLQAGRGAEADIVQRGGELGVTFQLGW